MKRYKVSGRIDESMSQEEEEEEVEEKEEFGIWNLVYCPK